MPIQLPPQEGRGHSPVLRQSPAATPGPQSGRSKPTLSRCTFLQVIQHATSMKPELGLFSSGLSPTSSLSPPPRACKPGHHVNGGLVVVVEKPPSSVWSAPSNQWVRPSLFQKSFIFTSSLSFPSDTLMFLPGLPCGIGICLLLTGSLYKYSRKNL